MGSPTLLTARSRLDIFPATVVHPVHGRLSRSRVIVADGRARVYVADGRDVTIAFEAEVAEITRTSTKVHDITEAGGAVFTVHKSCSCHTPPALRKLVV